MAKRQNLYRTTHRKHRLTHKWKDQEDNSQRHLNASVENILGRALHPVHDVH